MYRYNDIALSIYTEQEILQNIGRYYDFAMDAYSLIFSDLYDDIDWANFKLTISHEYKLKSNSFAIYGNYMAGSITLYLYSILKCVPIRYIYTIIVSVLVHELKHAGQERVNRDIFESDQAFINAVERPVEWETLKYLTEKREYLEDMLGVCIDIPSFKNYYMNYPVYDTSLYTQSTPEGYWISLIRVISGKEGVMSRVYDDIVREPTVILQLKYKGNKENRLFYSYAQYVKIDGLITYPDNELITLINNIATVERYRYSFKGFKLEDDSAFLLRLTYGILENSPLIKYDKPCTD